MFIHSRVDPKRHSVRGTVILPHGNGRPPKIALLTSEENHEVAEQSGADFIKDSDIFSQIENQKMKFEILVATLDRMSDVKKYARLLGPIGMMPNKKS